MENFWDIEKIQEILPQRYPFLFVDRAVEIDLAKGRVVCVKNVSINEGFFPGHFPGNPVMPGVVIIEAMAQASIVAYAALKPQIAERHPDYYLGRVEAKFSKPVRPGDQLVLEIEKEKLLDTAGIVLARAKVNGGLVAEARLTFGIKPRT